MKNQFFLNRKALKQELVVLEMSIPVKNQFFEQMIQSTC